jgi:hypothetical protein
MALNSAADPEVTVRWMLAWRPTSLAAHLARLLTGVATLACMRVKEVARLQVCDLWFDYLASYGAPCFEGRARCTIKAEERHGAKRALPRTLPLEAPRARHRGAAAAVVAGLRAGLLLHSAHLQTKMPTLNRCCIDNGLRRLLIMCYGADRLVRCEAKKVRRKQAPQCFTGLKSCFSTQLTDGLRWTLDQCCIDDGLRQLCIICHGADRLACCEAKWAWCEKYSLNNGSLASRPASPLSSPTDYSGRSIAAASMTDFDGFSSCATGPGPTVLPNAHCGAKQGKVQRKQAPQCFTGLKAYFSTQLADRLTALDVRPLLHR